MSCDVEISIFGTVSNPEAIWDLASSAAAEGRINYLEEFDIGAFLPMIEAVAHEGRALVLTRGRTSDFFEGVREACQAAGLSYVVKYGDAGADGFTSGISWHPGMAEEFEFLMNGKQAVLGVQDVRRAAAKGLDAVNGLLDAFEMQSKPGKIEIEPGFVEAYREYAGLEAEGVALR
jgi:hypothetical protein